MMFPFRAKNPPESLPLATYLLIGVNILIFLATSQYGLVARREVVENYGLRMSDYEHYKLFTSMFLHGDLSHLLGNMWFLYLFGSAVEGRLRSFKYLILYFLAGLAGDGLHMAILGGVTADVPSIGASGAIMGVMGAALYMFPHAPIRTAVGFGFAWRVMDARMWAVGLGYVAFDLIFAILLGSFSSTGHLAHLGGVGGGYLICALFRPKRDSQQVADAKGTLSDLKDYAALTTDELATLARARPDDHVLTLYWLYGVGRQGFPGSQEMFKRLRAHLPALLREEDPAFVAQTLLFFRRSPEVPRGALLQAAVLSEAQGQWQMALELIETVRMSTGTTDADRETATFRNAQWLDKWTADKARAVQLYDEFLRRWPMSPFVPNARERVRILAGR